MNKFIGLLLMISLFSACDVKVDQSLSDFENTLDNLLDKKLTDFKFHLILNESRFNTNYTYFLSYYEISNKIKSEINNYKAIPNSDYILTISQDFDSLVEHTKLIYKSITDSRDNSGGWFDYELKRLEGFFNPLNDKILNCKSIRDIQDFNIMLYQLDLFVVDFLLTQSKSGLHTFSDIKGPIMVEKKDSVYFHLTAFDSTRTPFILIGDFKPIETKWGLFYRPVSSIEKIDIFGFSTGLHSSKILNKDIMFYTTGPAGDTIQKPVRYSTVANKM